MTSHAFKSRLRQYSGRFLCALLSLWLLVLPAAAAGGAVPNASGIANAAPSVDPTGLSEGYTAVLYNNPNGLPTSEANAIAQTSEGFLWIGSYAGLIRYDGNAFERMDSTTGISNVRCLCVDSQDRLWIGTNDSGVFLMERGELRRWDKSNGMRSVSIRAIAEDGDGNICVGSTAGVAVLDAELQFTDLSEAPFAEETIQDLRRGLDGTVYGLTAGGDVFTLSGGSVRSFLDSEEQPVSGVCSIFPDPLEPGPVYLGTDHSEIWHGDPALGFADAEITQIAPLTDVESFEYIDGKLWLCSRDGIGSLDADGLHVLDNVPMNNSVGHAMTDYEGNLWFTSTRQGVMKVVPNQFSDVFARYGLSAEVVNSTCVYGKQLFIGTDRGLIVLENGKRADSVPLTAAKTASGTELEASDLLELLDGVRIRSIIRDSGGRLWISTWRRHGLLRYDAGELLAFTPEDGLLSDRVRVVSECADGAILVANTGGVSVIRGDRVAESFTEADGLGSEDTLTVLEGENGDIVVGSDGSGIYVIGQDGTRHVGTEDGLQSETVMRIKRSRTTDVYWIVTSNSIAYMTPDYRVTTIREFPYPNCFDVYENSKGDVWVIASNGIYVVRAQELLANGTIAPVHYSMKNGLPYVATANSYSELTQEGDLYIASSIGVVKVNVEKPFVDVEDLKMSVPFLDVDGTRLYPEQSGGFTVPSNTHKLTVSGFVYCNSLVDPQISYHLEGFDSSETTLNRSELIPVDYTNLRGGDYFFVMKLKDQMGRGNKQITVRITKEKKIYERTWFMIVGGLLLLLLLEEGVRHYIRMRMRKLEKRHRETMTLISEITEAFAKVIDMKDKYTNGHSGRVAKYTYMLAKELGYNDEEAEKYYRIALLHDIGKIGVPPEVLNKPERLTQEEFELMQSHTTLGYEALKDISIMPELATGAQAHHERPDGKGYPNHLRGDEIPRVAQIIGVADCFDAMYSTRPYRQRMNFDKVVSIIREGAGTQLTQDVVDAFLRLVDKGKLRAPDDVGGGSMENIENFPRQSEPLPKA